MWKKIEPALLIQMPMKSLAAALLFTVFLGPIGLLYATTLGGCIMLVLGFIVVSNQFLIPILLVWIASCIWGVIATNLYNKKIGSAWVMQKKQAVQELM